MKTPEEILKFYKSKTWHLARDYCKMNNHYCCEECGSPKDLEVHHKIALTLTNYQDPMIALNQDNLQCLCRTCHMAKRGAGVLRDDLVFTDSGQIVPREYETRSTPPTNTSDF